MTPTPFPFDSDPIPLTPTPFPKRLNLDVPSSGWDSYIDGSIQYLSRKRQGHEEKFDFYLCLDWNNTMIIHCTKKLAAKLPDVSAEPQIETSPLGSWHANLYVIDRRNCLLFCHDDIRYTVFVAGLVKRDFANLGALFKQAFVASLVYMGMADSQVRRAELALGPAQCDTSTNRSVQGSLNQMRFMLDAYVEEVADVMLLNPLAVTGWLCNYPVGTGNGKNSWMANEAMKKKVMSL